MVSPQKYRRSHLQTNHPTSPDGMSIVSPISSSKQSPSIIRSNGENLSKAAALRRKRLLYDPNVTPSPIIVDKTPQTPRTPRTPSPMRAMDNRFTPGTKHYTPSYRSRSRVEANTSEASIERTNVCNQMNSGSKYQIVAGDSHASDVEGLRASNQQKEMELRKLQDQIQQIEKGLGSIDKERTMLIGKSKQLEAEKRKVQRQLMLREKEILALIKRCASQEDKMKEAASLRSKNRELEKELGDVQQKLAAQNQERADLASLRKKLDQSELDREKLQDKLFKIQREHDGIAETLKDCLAHVTRLTEEKEALEVQRQRDRRHAEAELEKQRQAHHKHANSLKEDLESQQERLIEMERILQDNMATNTSLRREKAIMVIKQKKEVEEVVSDYEAALTKLKAAHSFNKTTDCSPKDSSKIEARYQAEIEKLENQQTKEIEDVVQKYETMLSELQEANENLENFKTSFEAQPSAIEEQYQEEVARLQDELENKDAFMQDLEDEFSDLMSNLMAKTSEFEAIEEEKVELENQLLRLRNMESDHGALLDFVNIVEDNLAEITSENAFLIVEKENLCDENANLELKVSRLECQIKQFFENRKAREADFRALIEAEQQEVQDALQNQLATAKKRVESLDIEIESKNRQIAQLEDELKATRKSVVSHDCKIRIIRLEKQRIAEKASEEENTSKANEELELLQSINRELAQNETLRPRLEAERDEAQKRVAALEEEIAWCTAEYASLEQALEFANDTLDDRLKQIESLKEKIIEQSSQREELEKVLADACHEVTSTKKELSTLSAARASLEEEVENLRKSAHDKDNVIEALENENHKCKELVSSIESDVRERESLLRNQHEAAMAKAMSELESLELQIKSFNHIYVERTRELELARQALAEYNHMKQPEDVIEKEGLNGNVEEETIDDTSKPDGKNISLEHGTTSLLEQDFDYVRELPLFSSSHSQATTNENYDDEDSQRSLDLALADSCLDEQISSWDEISSSRDLKLDTVQETTEKTLDGSNASKGKGEKEILDERDLETRLDYATQKNECLEQQIELKDASCALLMQELEATRKSLADFENRVQEGEKLRASLERDIVEANEKVVKLELELMQNSAQTGLRSDLASQLTETHAILAEKEHKIQTIGEECEKNEHLRFVLEQNIEDLKHKIVTLHKQLFLGEIIVKSREKELQSLQEKCRLKEVELSSDYQKKLVKATTNIASLEEQVATSLMLSSKFESELDSTRQALLEKESHTQELEKELRASKFALQSARQSLDKYRATEAEKQVNEQSQHKLLGTLEEAQSKIRSLENELASSKLDNRNLEGELKATRTSLADSRAREHYFEEEIMKKDQFHSVIESKLGDATKQVSLLQEKIASHEENHLMIKEKCSTLEVALKKTLASLAENELVVGEQDKQIVSMKCQLEKSKADAKSACNKQSILEVQLTDANETIVSLEEDIKSLQQKCRTFHDQNLSLKENLTEGASKLTEQENLIKDLQIQNEEVLARLESHVTESTERIEATEIELKSSMQKHESLQTELSGALALISEKDAKINSFVDDQVEKSNRISSLEKALVGAEAKVATADDELHTLKERYSVLQKELRDTQKSLDSVMTVEESHKKSEGRIIELERLIADAHEEIGLLEEEVSSRDKRIVSLLKQEQICKTEIKAARAEMDKASSHFQISIAAANDEVKSLEADLATKTTRLSVLEDDFRKVMEERDSHSKGAAEEKAAKIMKIESLVIASQRIKLMSVESALTEMSNRVADHEQVEADLSKKVNSFQLQLKTRNDQVLSLEDELSSTRELLQFQNEKVAQIERELTRTLEKSKEDQKLISTMRSEINSNEQVRETVEALEEELQQTRDLLEENSKSSQEANKRLERDIKKLETDIALRDDELRELRLFELNESEEAIATLEEETKKLRQEIKEKELTITSLVGAYEQQLGALKAKAEQAERQYSERLKASEKLLADAEAKLEGQDSAEALAAAQKTLADRSALLSNMVSLNKELELKLKEQNLKVCNLEDDAKQRSSEVSKLRQELEGKEKKFEAMMLEERAAFEKENSILKDKLEACLQKTPSEGKVLKDRNVRHFQGKQSSLDPNQKSLQSQIPRVFARSNARQLDGTGASVSLTGANRQMTRSQVSKEARNSTRDAGK